MSRKSLRAGMLCVSLLLAFSAAWAQSGTSVTGIVSDPQGAIVPGVTVTLTNRATGAARTALTDESGVYLFPQLTPGKYSIKAELQGFKTVVADDVEILINTSGNVNLKFTEVGGITETVTVKGAAAAINTVDATIGNAFNDVQVRELPLEGRNVVGLLSLQPGVTFIGDTTDSRNGSVNGGKSDQANVTLDGADVNDQQNGFAFNSVLRVTLDSVQEFRVTTTGINAEQGRSSGAQISLVTRSGTNQFHGSAYEYHRNTVTTANEYFLKRSQLGQGLPNKQPKLIRNVFGFTFGGPLKKDRLFMFVNYEGRRDASEASAVRTVPSNDLRNGILKYRNTSGGITTLSSDDIKRIDPAGIGVNPSVLAIFKQYPAPNDTSVGDGINFTGFRFAAPTPFKYNDWVSRLDYNLTADARHTLYWRGNLQNDSRLGGPQFPGKPPNTKDLNNSKGFATSYKALLSNKLVNSLVWGYTRQGVETSGVSTQSAVSFRGLTDLNSLSRSSGRIVPVHSLTDDLTWQRGSHSLQFGTTMRWIRNGRFNFANSFHSASTNSSWLLGTGSGLSNPVSSTLLPAFRTAYRDAMMATLGIVSQGNARYNYDREGKALAVGSPVLRNYGADEYEFYAQDSWRVRPNLTLTYGLRYGLFSPPYETNGLQVSPTISLGEWFNLRGVNMEKGIASNAAPRISVDLAGPANGKKGFYDWDKNNFSPRFAFAWSPGASDGFLKGLTGGPGNFVIRGGFGVAFDRIGGGLATTFDAGGSFGLSTGLTNPSSSLTEITAPRFTSLTEIPSSLLRAAPPGGFPQTPPSVFAITSSMDNTIRTPYSMLINFSIQRQLPHGLSFEAAYVGRLARKLLITDDLAMPINLKDPVSGMDYFKAATELVLLAEKKTPSASVPKIAFWENLFPGIASSTKTATQVAYDKYVLYSPDYTSALYDLDVGCSPACSKLGRYTFFNDQYSALGAWRSRAWSNYHAAQFMLRKRFSGGTQFDLNYTFGKSLDLASSTERVGAFTGFTVNAWDPGQRKAVSDFDTRHSINANWIAELPFGRGKKVFGGANSLLDQFIGGWQVSGIYRQTSGLPVGVGNGRFWPTNWNITGFATRIGAIPETETTKNALSVAGSRGPNMFSDPAKAFEAYRYTYPGGVGTRNDLYGDGFFTIDLGLAKFWKLPMEGHRVAFRWETFNISNTVRFDPQAITLDLGNVGKFGEYNGTLTNPRVMQFSLRYEF